MLESFYVMFMKFLCPRKYLKFGLEFNLRRIGKLVREVHTKCPLVCTLIPLICVGTHCAGTHKPFSSIREDPLGASTYLQHQKQNKCRKIDFSPLLFQFISSSYQGMTLGAMPMLGGQKEVEQVCLFYFFSFFLLSYLRIIQGMYGTPSNTRANLLPTDSSKCK